MVAAATPKASAWLLVRHCEALDTPLREDAAGSIHAAACRVRAARMQTATRSIRARFQVRPCASQGQN